jgi:hypothetical protein
MGLYFKNRFWSQVAVSLLKLKPPQLLIRVRVLYSGASVRSLALFYLKGSNTNLSHWYLIYMVCQWHRFIFDPYLHLTALEEAEIIPGKDSDTKIKPLALSNGHGRYITITPERTLASVGECPLHIIWPLIFWPFHFRNRRVTAVSLLKPPSGSRSG